MCIGNQCGLVLVSAKQLVQFDSFRTGLEEVVRALDIQACVYSTCAMISITNMIIPGERLPALGDKVTAEA